MFMVWEDPWYKHQNGLLGRIAGGWEFAPIFTAGSGAPVYCNTQTDAQSFGSGDGNDYFDNEQCVFTTPYNGGHTAHYGTTGSNGVGIDGAVNLFKNPEAVWNQVRPPILGIDAKNPGVGPITGLPYWNVDVSLLKNFKVAEPVSFEASMIVTNLFNHDIFADPTLALYSPDAWGTLSSQGNTPRKMEFGARVSF
jgi:hypothetical protein